MNTVSSRDSWQPARALRCPRPVAAFVGFFCLATVGWTTNARGYDPPNGEWTKSEPTDLRVMTYNVEDGIATNAEKTDGFNQWDALVRTIAALRPDVLLLQETADAGSVDSVSEMEVVIDLFLHGGVDVFQGGTVTSYVQKYAPGFDMPHVFISAANDGFNRNVILSRYPFADLNGDTDSTYSTMGFLFADAYAPGGNGGIRGFQHAEIDLPDDVYEGDVVIGNSHLKAGGSSSDFADRLEAAKNIAYYIDYWYNGAGTGTPDPNDKILDSPAATMILPAETPVVIGGDWNEDEGSNGRRGPALWHTQAEVAEGTDGTDRDRTDMTFDSAAEPFSGDEGTRGSGKLDYLAWQDSIVTPRDTFVFDSSAAPSSLLPPELATYAVPGLVSGLASDHFPVIADLTLPLNSCDFDADCDDGVYCNGAEICNAVDQCEAGAPPCPRIELCVEADQICLECIADQDCSEPLPRCRTFDNTCVECTTSAHCDDGDPCNGTESCVQGNLCADSVLSADCNENGVEDSCDIDNQTSADCNANGVPDDCELADQTSLDCNGNLVPDECDLGDQTSEDCNVNDIPDECDIASGLEEDLNDNGIPDACEPPVTVPDPVVSDPAEPGSRYLTLAAPPPTTAGALEEIIRVTFVTLDGFLVPQRDYLYVGAPFDAPEENEDQPGLTFRAAGLTCEPVFHNWPVEGTFSVFGAEIVPSSTYELQRANTTCPDLSDGGCWSAPVVMATGKYADILPPYDDPEGPAQPDFTDVSGFVGKFLAEASAPVKALAQIQPNVVFPSRPIDFRDISAAIEAFLGVAYADVYSGPCDCPSQVTCGVTSCSQDADCTGGLCIDSFCADICGRCSPP